MQQRIRCGVNAGFASIGAAFLAISASGQPAFVGVGLAFMVIGLAALARARRGG